MCMAVSSVPGLSQVGMYARSMFNGVLLPLGFLFECKLPAYDRLCLSFDPIMVFDLQWCLKFLVKDHQFSLFFFSVTK